MVIDAKGQVIAHTFHRALIRSAASLSYEDAQAAIDGHPNERTAPLLETVLKPLWSAYDPAPERPRVLLLDTDADGGLRMAEHMVTASSLMQELALDRRLPVQADKCEIVRGIAPSWHYVAEVGIRRFGCELR